MIDDMEYIVEPTNGDGWVLAKKGYNKDNIAELIRSSDSVVSDLDDTVAESPIREMIKLGSKELKYLLNPACWLWAVLTKIRLRLDGEEAESTVGKSFTRFFLRKKSVLDRITKRYTRDFAESTLYPGVSDFYKTLPGERTKIFVTRNIKEITDAYKDAIGFDDALVEQYDKKASIEKILNLYPKAKSFVIIGDSQEDEQMLNFLRDKQQQGGQINTILGIYVADSPENINPNFDINIGKNYGGLVKLMQQ